MTLIASIITFSKKKKLEKKCYPRPSTWHPRPRHGTLDPRPSTLDKKIDSVAQYITTKAERTWHQRRYLAAVKELP